MTANLFAYGLAPSELLSVSYGELVYFHAIMEEVVKARRQAQKTR